jgi:hypothetical protein
MKIEDDLKKIKWKATSIFRQSYWDYLTTKTSKTNGFDTMTIMDRRFALNMY